MEYDAEIYTTKPMLDSRTRSEDRIPGNIHMNYNYKKEMTTKDAQQLKDLI